MTSSVLSALHDAVFGPFSVIWETAEQQRLNAKLWRFEEVFNLQTMQFRHEEQLERAFRAFKKLVQRYTSERAEQLTEEEELEKAFRAVEYFVQRYTSGRAEQLTEEEEQRASREADKLERMAEKHRRKEEKLPQALYNQVSGLLRRRAGIQLWEHTKSFILAPRIQWVAKPQIVGVPQVSGLLLRLAGIEERGRKEAQNQEAELWLCRDEGEEERARKEAQNQEAELRWLKGELQGYCKAIENQEVPFYPGSLRWQEFCKATENQEAVLRWWEEEQEIARKQRSVATRIHRIFVYSGDERVYKETENQREQFDMQNTSVELRKSVGRMDDDDSFFTTLISQQQNNFKPNQETNISSKDSGIGEKAQRRQWEGMESNSRKTDDRNILVTTAARGVKNRGQKQGNGEDNVKKQTLVLLTTGTVSRSPVGHETGRVDIYAGDKNLLNADFRKEHSIHDIIAMQQISVPCDAANDSDVKFLVRMRPYGEGKDSWEHCTTQDGDVGLPEEQPLYISQILRGSSTFPASATWVLETPDKCTPSSTLEAVLEINMVTGDSMVPSNGSSVTSGNPVAQLSIQVQGKELHDAVPDLERSDRQQCGITLEEKYQTEPMEK